ncbi:hypothetical protein AQUCO_01200279v1 [Aquilegia coerulea]|uniref:F-box domain-containing protein n=1 Tax=Aquilegia coerulea TaxID=218851 RepID=A0A2G5E594_AQUCA|nr:hypothetical protein AQUCO_01200279v1 [Aquilegia coerulea]
MGNSRHRPNLIGETGFSNSSNRRSRFSFEHYDFLSQLPHSVVLHILSLLPLRDCVVTSGLSKRWRYVWTHTSKLNIDENVFYTKMDRNSPCSMCDELPPRSEFRRCTRHSLEGRRQQFVQFVDRTLQLRSGDTIDYFRLSFNHNSYYGYTSRIDLSIRRILMSNVRVLELSFSQQLKFPLNDLRSNESGPFELPNGPYESKSLKILTLNFCNFKLANFEVFHSLRRIHLKQVLLLEGSIGDLVSKCPLLEDFHLYLCNIHRRYFQYEGDLQLKNLIIRRCTMNTQFDIIGKFSAPRLLSLVIDEDKFRLYLVLTKQELPGISCLLSSCPYLETLSLEVDLINQQNWVFESPLSLSFDEEQFWKSQSLHFYCLETVYIDGFVGETFDIPLVEFLLENSRVLECMTINWNSNKRRMSSEEYSHFIETTTNKVLHMRRASSKARVEFI